MAIDISFHKGLSWNKKGTAAFGESTTPSSRGSSASWKSGVSKSCLFVSTAAINVDYNVEQVNLTLSYISADVLCKLVPYFSGAYNVAWRQAEPGGSTIIVDAYTDTWKPVINELEYQRFEGCYTGSYVEVRRGTKPALKPINECNYSCATANIPFLKMNFSLNDKFDIGGKCVTVNRGTGSMKLKGGMLTTLANPIVTLDDIYEARTFPEPGAIVLSPANHIGFISEAFMYAPMP